MGYQESLEWLYSQENMGIKLGLERMKELLRSLGDPQLALRTVHVAGTNGKGSISAMVSSVLQESGHVTGLYTSPHLVDFIERIKVNGVSITEEETSRLAECIRRVIESPEFSEGRRVTFFEITTALAFLHFKEKGVKIAVVEVGMGGRLDATNVIRPDCTVISRIGIEHTQYLGDTIAKIAYEKAGIIKEGVTVITAEDNEIALRVIDAVARDRGAPLLVLGRDFEFKLIGNDITGIDVHLHSINRDVHVPLIGAYQAENAAVACECVLEVRNRGMEVPDASVAIGLSKVSWPGRMEKVSDRPLMFFDVSHTPQGAKAVAKELRELHPGEWVMVLGVLNDKDLEGICEQFGPLVRSAVATEVQNSRAFPAEVVAKALSGRSGSVVIEKDVGKAIEKALSLSGPDDAILVTGSLYVVGEAKRWLARKGTK